MSRWLIVLMFTLTGCTHPWDIQPPPPQDPAHGRVLQCDKFMGRLENCRYVHL